MNQRIPESPPAESTRSLAELTEGETASVVTLDLATEVATRLMELGFIPGSRVTAGQSAPGGDPRVFQVDGSEVALRRETTRHIRVRVVR